MGPPKVGDLRGEDLVQAVVVADSFNTSAFAPLTLDTPACLLPLAGRPLLEYTLECLALGGVQDVILYLTANAAKVKDWLASSMWSSSHPAPPFPVTCITNEDCRSFGDAMRDLDEKGVLRSEFILVSGDLMSNLDLVPFLHKHRDRVKADKHCIMTCVYTEVARGHPLCTRGSDLVLACDKSNDQILFYQQAPSKSTSFPVDLFQHDEVEVICDLLDASIYICSPAVLALFSDNFDIQDMPTLINEIIESELVDSTLYLSATQEGFACRVTNPYLYILMNEKLLNRWVYPLVPDRRRFGEEKCALLRNSSYRGSRAVIGRGAVIHADTYIGHSAKIGEKCELTGSSVEANSELGSGCHLERSIVMRGSNIGANCSLTDCIIGENVVVAEGTRLSGRVIIGHEVHLGVSALAEHARISAQRPDADDDFGDDDDDNNGTDGVDAAGDNSLGPRAFYYVEDNEDESCEDEDDLHERNKIDPWGEAIAGAHNESAEGDSDSDEDDDSHAGGGGGCGAEDDPDDWDEQDDEEDEDGDVVDGGGGGKRPQFDEHEDVTGFRREVTDSLRRAAEEGINTDNLVLEINGSKHAWNTTLSEVNRCVLTCVLTLGLDVTLPPAKLLQAVKVNIGKFKSLLVKYSKSKSGQAYYLEGVQDLVRAYPSYLDILPKVLESLYDLDILDSTTMLTWGAKLQDSRLRSKIQPFLAWLEESDEESSSGDE